MSRPTSPIFLRPRPSLLARIDRAARAQGVSKQELIYRVLDELLPPARTPARGWQELKLPGFAPDSPPDEPTSDERHAGALMVPALALAVDAGATRWWWLFPLVVGYVVVSAVLLAGIARAGRRSPVVDHIDTPAAVELTDEQADRLLAAVFAEPEPERAPHVCPQITPAHRPTPGDCPTCHWPWTLHRAHPGVCQLDRHEVERQTIHPSTDGRCPLCHCPPGCHRAPIVQAVEQ